MALLITEVFNDDCGVLVEQTESGAKKYTIEGNFMQADLANRNGRIYPSAILEKEMNRYNEQFIKPKRSLGELGHPEGPQINGERVSHLITEMTKSGSNFIGKAKIIDTPMGKIVKTFIDEGVKIGVSTRGLGSVKAGANGIMEVQNDFHLATVDIVTDPSGPDCFVKGIMENSEYYFDIAASSWRLGTPALVEMVQDSVEYVSVDLYNEAMDRLQVLESTISTIKKSFKKPSAKIDEQKAFALLEAYFTTLKK